MTKIAVNPLNVLDFESSPFYYQLMDANLSNEKFLMMIKSDFHQTDSMSTRMFSKPISKILLSK